MTTTEQQQRTAEKGGDEERRDKVGRVCEATEAENFAVTVFGRLTMHHPAFRIEAGARQVCG